MPTARAWREYPQRYRYEAGVCKKCGKWFFPPRLVCDACGHREFETKAMRRTGKILTHTTIRVPPAPYADQAPFVVAVVEMDDGPRITTQVADLQEGQLKIGQPVKLEFRKIYTDGHAGPIQYGYKAVPVQKRSAILAERYCAGAAAPAGSLERGHAACRESPIARRAGRATAR